MNFFTAVWKSTEFKEIQFFFGGGFDQQPFPQQLSEKDKKNLF